MDRQTREGECIRLVHTANYLSRVQLLQPFNSPAWSPNGRTIATVALHAESDGFWSNLIEVPIRGGLERPLTDKQHWTGPWDLAWLPDGRGLIVNTRRTGRREIDYVSMAKGELRPITTDTNDYDGVSLTADSHVLATVQEKSSFDSWVAPVADVGNFKPITSGGSSAREAWVLMEKWCTTCAVVGEKQTFG